ncbi:hypothetical protein AB0870_00570 [Microbacterium proteolyticum]|uniref:hypothetical protein n=1 Tax=Microbacterium proteolyticum TaxID=1572644 RepID=UPI002416D6F6|nr:hypothetical protein [Microbacterium proteolyticum]
MALATGLLGLLLALAGAIIAGIALVRGQPSATSRRWLVVSGALVAASLVCFAAWVSLR